MEFNRPARPHDLAELARVMQSPGSAVEHVHALGQRIGLPASLAEIGIAQEDLRGMAESSFKFKRLIDNNPRALDVNALEQILDAAWHGDPARLEEAQSVRS
jgi:alcohol dehydrogenase